MSTRAQITIEGQSGTHVYLYKHSDGYPEGVLPILEPFTKDFFARRGFDPEYFLARAMHALIDAHKNVYDNWEKEALAKGGSRLAKSMHEIANSLLGYGIDTAIHGDIKYLYTVTKDGKIHTQEVGYQDGKQVFTTIDVSGKHS